MTAATAATHRLGASERYWDWRWARTNRYTSARVEIIAFERLHSLCPVFLGSDLTIPSRDGALLYRFDLGGRHLNTIYSFTGATILSFDYDELGRLTAIWDGDGNVTSIARDEVGRANTIVGPFGQETPLELDENGNLAKVVNPAGEAIRFTSTPDGLLTTRTDAAGNTSHFTYDNVGRLIRDEDSEGGFTELLRSETDTGFEVAVSTGLGRTTVYELHGRPSSTWRLVTLFPTGTSSELVVDANGSREIRTADGTQLNLVPSPDPRWGMNSPLWSITMRTPAGLTHQVTREGSVMLEDGANPPWARETDPDCNNKRSKLAIRV